MKVIIEAGVFHRDRITENHGDLLGLFSDCRRGRHTIAIDPSGAADYRKWIDGESTPTRALCERVLQDSIKWRVRRLRVREIRIADVTIPSWPTMRLPLSTALPILRRPLRLFLENARNDHNFLRVMTRIAVEFDLEKLIRDRMVEIQPMGGISEGRKLIESDVHAQENACRMWVMCDSDTRQAWLDSTGQIVPERLSDDARKLKKVCEDRGIPIHILRRRAIDNYVPPSLLEQWSRQKKEERAERHQSFVSLTNEQRHHYNMKEGFAQDAKDPEYKKRVGSLYDGISPEVRVALDNGFKDGRFGVATLFDETKIHDNLKTLRVHEAWLRTDKQEAEARQIAEAIKELL